MQPTTRLSPLCLLLIGFALPLAAQASPAELARDALGGMEWRSLGPSNFGGRVVDVEVDPRDRSVWYVVTGSGGIWKTVNKGTTFEPLFDRQPVFSIGDLALAPSAPDVLYVGTGEANNQRSSYWGNGIWKSTDAGKTWSHVGLEGTDHIGRVVVHPKNPDIVYVAALGALYSPNRERGLYRTTDGGKSWNCVQWISEDVGFVDIVLDPSDPGRLLAASYDRRRRAWDFRETGPGSGIWRSEDAGATWERIEGGLPGGEIGRIGLAYAPSDPAIVYATIENGNPAVPEAKTDVGTTEAASGRREPSEGTAPRRRLIGGEIYRSQDGGKSWKKVNESQVGGSPAYYYGQIVVDPRDAETVYVLSVPLWRSRDGGKTWKNDTARGIHVDHHALWIDPTDTAHLLLGNDGGMHESFDRGEHWDHFNELPIGQVYAIGVDLQDPYWVWGGLQDNGTWGIPSAQTTSLPLSRSDALRINGGDGFYVVVDPRDPDLIYSESQFGALSRLHVHRGERKSIRPQAERGQPRLRFNWMSPIALSPQHPDTIYFGSQYLHRSRNRGDDWQTISPDLTTNDAAKIEGDVPHCTITTIAASPLRAGLLWVGTDDGRVWLTRNDGERWIELTDRFQDVPRGLWVSRVEASYHDEKIAYVAFTGYREDDRNPYLFLTTDGGDTFRSLSANLPRASVNVVREHPRNPDVLLVGHESGVCASIDAGGTWHPLGSKLPTTPVHDLVVHPREPDVVVGTHGRGVWVLDATPLEELDDDLLARPFHAFRARDGRQLGVSYSNRYSSSNRTWTADRSEHGAAFHYWLREESDAGVSLEVVDATGKVLRTIAGSSKAGLHRVLFDPNAGRGRGGFGGGRREPPPGPGQYAVRVRHGENPPVLPFWIRASAPAPASWLKSSPFTRD